MSCIWMDGVYGAGWYDYNTGDLCTMPQSSPNPNIQIQGGAGGTIYANQNWLDKLLNTVTSVYAINQHQPYVPTTAQPVSQTRYPITPYNAQGYPVGAYPITANAGGQFGASLQNFITNNTGILLILGAGVVLLMMSPPARRNGIKRNGLFGEAATIIGLKPKRRRRRR